MECPRCSAKLYRGTRFCPTCGLLVEDVVSQIEPEEEATGVLDKTELLAKLAAAEASVTAAQAADDATAGEGTAAGEGAVAAVADDAADKVDAPADEAVEEKSDEGAAPADADEALEAEPGPEPEPEPEPEVEPETESESEVEPEGEPEEPADVASELERTATFEPLSASDAATAPVIEADAETYTAAETTADSAGQDSAAQDSATQDSAYASAPKPSLVARVRAFAAHDRVLTIAVAAAVVLAVGGIAVWGVHDAQAKRAEQERIEAEHRARTTPQIVGVNLSLADFDTEQGSPVPVRVTGESTSGKKIDEIRLLSAAKPELELLPGSYSVALAGNIVTLDGRMYTGSVDTYELKVSDGLSEDEPEEQSSTPTFAFVQVAAQDVSQEDVDAIRFWMETAGVENAQAYVEALEQARQAAIDTLEQEQAAEEEAQLRETEQMMQQMEQQLAQQRAQEQEATSDANAGSGQ